jgi:uracil-DNA glycosylase
VNLESALSNLNPLWKELLQEEFSKPYFLKLTQYLKDTDTEIYPKEENIFSIYNAVNPDDVKVVILGQDPYHDVDQAHGFAFSVDKVKKLPPSLINIFKELSSDLSMPIRTNGNLNSWAEQGVFLLNSVLTVQAHKANSHKGFGWEEFTKKTIETINKYCTNVVFILWGSHARKYNSLIDSTKHKVIESVHPSPLSVYRGFWGSKPFSMTNEYLRKHGKSVIDWNR